MHSIFGSLLTLHLDELLGLLVKLVVQLRQAVLIVGLYNFLELLSFLLLRSHHLSFVLLAS